jgi:multiple sugar transport system ATP-binding protein
VAREILVKAGSAQDVLLGVRPEDLQISTAGTSMTVTLVEELGADAYVYGDATAADGTVIPLIARTSGSTGTRRGDVVKVAAGRTHVFSVEGDRPRLS